MNGGVKQRIGKYSNFIEIGVWINKLQKKKSYRRKQETLSLLGMQDYQNT